MHVYMICIPRYKISIYRIPEWTTLLDALFGVEYTYSLELNTLFLFTVICIFFPLSNVSHFTEILRIDLTDESELQRSIIRRK